MGFDPNTFGVWKASDVTRRVERNRRWALVCVYVLAPIAAAGATWLLLWALGL